MIDNIANIFLSLLNEQFIISLIILGYIWLDRDVFYHATCLILISIIFNLALKVTFKIPLCPLIGKEGFAFPSGHMQLATTFFGWLAFNNNLFIVRALAAGIITGIGLSLVHFQYHNYYDVIAAVLAAYLQVIAYYQVINKNNISRWIIIVFSTILITYIYMITNQISSHIWKAYYTMIGFMGSDQLFRNNKSLSTSEMKVNTAIRIITTLICVVSVLIIMYIFSKIGLAKLALPSMVINLPWLLIGFIVPYSTNIALIILLINKNKLISPNNHAL